MEGLKDLFSRVTGAPSKKTSYMVVGQDPGPSKMEKAKNLGIKILDEDQFYELINATADQSSTSIVSSPKKTLASDESEKSQKAEAIVSHNRKDKGKGRLEEQKPSLSRPISNELWTEKYKPQKYDEVIGNKALIEKLAKWLKSWAANRKNNFPKGGKDDVSQFRAALLSGPPGIGKTTAAHMVSKIEGFEVIEFNASDTRSKKSLDATVKETTHSSSIMDLFSATPKQKVLIMDEVDGMSGGDRGGSAELIQIIKKSKIPIICLCNDRSSPKIRSLANHCLDLRFRRPTSQQVEARLKKICEKEQLILLPNAIGELVQSTSGDIRQILNLLSTYRLSADRLSFDDSKKMYFQLK
jgi:replication factor C subunit 1